jgi:hypothetical protein
MQDATPDPGTHSEDSADTADADAALAEPGEPITFEDLQAEFTAGAVEFWKPALRGALRDAITYRMHHNHHEDNPDAISLWRQCAEALGIDLSETS